MDGRMIEWPPHSGIVAEYAPDEERFLREMIVAAEDGRIPLSALDREFGFLHDAKALLDARILPDPDAVPLEVYEPVSGSPFQIPPRAQERLARLSPQLSLE